MNGIVDDDRKQRALKLADQVAVVEAHERARSAGY